MRRETKRRQDTRWPRLPRIPPGGSKAELITGALIVAATMGGAWQVGRALAVGVGLVWAGVFALRWRRVRRLEILARPLPEPDEPHHADGNPETFEPISSRPATPQEAAAEVGTAALDPNGGSFDFLEAPAPPTAPSPPSPPHRG